MDVEASSEPDDVGRAIVEPPPRISLIPAKPLSRLLLGALAALFGAATLGVALAPTLALKYPLILLALNPLPRHVILVAPHTPLVPLLIVVSLRGSCSCIIAFEVGRHYGPAGLELFERKSPRLAGFVRAFERVFLKAAPVFLILSPGPLTSTLAAVSGNRRWVTWLLSWCGFLIWAYVNYRIGDWLKPWTAPIMAFIQRYLIETTVACAVIVFAYQWIARRRRLRQARPPGI